MMGRSCAAGGRCRWVRVQLALLAAAAAAAAGGGVDLLTRST